jgi:hypothetical protein
MLKMLMQLDSETKNYEYMTAIFLPLRRQYLVQGVHEIYIKSGYFYQKLILSRRRPNGLCLGL